MDFGLATEFYPEEYRYQPEFYKQDQAEPDMLQIMQQLHASLDPRTVFACYGKMIGQILPIQGVHLQVAKQQFHWGKHHGISLKHVAEQDRQSLSIHYRLISALTSSQLDILQGIERLLLQPLLNAIKYQNMSQQAMFDSLTNLGNRHYYNQTIAKSLAKANRQSEPHLSLVILDIDNFKQLNDTYGHSFGDEILHKFAYLLNDSIRDSDQAFRIGGDEFVVIVHGCHDAAAVLCQRLQKAMAKQAVLKEHQVHTSMGIAKWEASLSAKELYDRADSALYQAKAAGRHCYKTFKVK
ncbi:GGDEF domain-containing protein [Shewanella gelidii]|uniref:diguanylate cyclase n=1 Tax=Shewanella gelidii TaxID=1642821 RepID=A0A917N7D5_9GAMM|nr:GGDEF domain-containing protein [Shewanella gelidii]MCL1097330.1 GGDEF domain-containing protein [Shewanella gelidii]GGI74281.1 diguanylate cyclase [Shewanella gelidii]